MQENELKCPLGVVAFLFFSFLPLRWKHSISRHYVENKSKQMVAFSGDIAHQSLLRLLSLLGVFKQAIQ